MQNPILCGKETTLDYLIEQYGSRAIALLESVWHMQVVALRGFMEESATGWPIRKRAINGSEEGAAWHTVRMK